MTSTPAPPIAVGSSARLRSLDGLRGLAALVVVVHHTLFILPVMVTIQAAESALGESWLLWTLTHTPLHIIWAGEEAVLVFFVLSGLVLALPATRHGIRWRAYYPRRLARLYLPVWAAVAVAVILYLAFPREASPARSEWLNDRAQIPVSDAWNGVLLLNGTTAFNTPLWSLQWEVVFSLLLPVFLLLGRLSRRAAVVAVVGLLGMVALGTYAGAPAARYLPMFGLGVLMAFHSEYVARLAGRLDVLRHPGRAWGWLAVLTVVLLTARWTTAGVEIGMSIVSAAASGATLVGAVLTVFLAMHWTRARALLESRPFRWLGVRSFSLYIIHEPVIVTVAFLVPVAVSPWLAMALAIPAALVVTTVVYRVAEAPAHQFSRRIGQRLEGRTSSPSSSPVAGRFRARVARGA